MAITPSGTPAWTRAATHEDYGGNVDKQNYLSRGVIDALTDVGAEELCRMAADLEACVRTSPFCVMSVRCNDGTCAAPTFSSVLMQTGVRATSYEGDAAPAGFPSGARDSDGIITVVFSASYADPYGVTGAWAPSHVLVTTPDYDTLVTGSVAGTSATFRGFDPVTLEVLPDTGFDAVVW
jgi:hypothetical protein